MSLVATIKEAAIKAIRDLYNIDILTKDITINQTKPEFEGDYTIVLFTLTKQLRKAPEQLGKEIGEHLVANQPTLFTSFNVIKGFLNLTVADTFFVQYLQENFARENISSFPSDGKRIIVEYSSPNTNK